MSRLLLLAFTLFWCSTSFAQKISWKEKLAQIEKMSDDSLKASELNDMAIKLSQKNTDDALMVAEKIKAIPKQTHHTEAEYFQAMGVISRKKKDYKSSIDYHKKAVQKYTVNSNYPQLVNSEGAIALALMESGNRKEAEVYFEKAIETGKKSGDPELVDDAYKEYTGAVANAGDYAGKLKLLNEKLHYFEKTKESNPFSYGAVLIELSYHFFHMDRNQDALNYILDARPYVEKANNEFQMLDCYNTTGAIYKNLKKMPEAITYFHKTIELLEKPGSKFKQYLGTLYINLGITYYEMGDYEKGFEFKKKGLEDCIQSGDERCQYNSYLAIGIDLAELNKDYPKAIEYLSEAEKMGNQFADLYNLQYLYKGMYLSHAGIGEFGKAYEYQKKYLEIRDSTLNSEKQKQINELEAKYENEKKEQQIQVLNRDNKISQLQLLRQQETLTLQEAENEAKQKSILLLEKESSLKEAELEKEKSKSEAERNKAALANQQKAAAEQEAANQKKIVYLFAGGSLLLVFFLFSLYRGYRQKKKANEEILQQKKIIEQQKEIVEERNKEVTDSINYAKRLQEAILPPIPFIKEFLPESFVYYQPKDIVAGDFFWMEHTHAPGEKGKVFFAVADCTGHGVPGAMVSVVCSNALNRAVKEFGINDPGKILDKVTDLVQATFSRSENQVRDGMDISICVLDYDQQKLFWSGANNPLWLIRANELVEYKPNKQPVGHFENRVPFQTHEIELQREDVFYLFSDGYADQFGGEHLPGGKAGGKKFKESNLKKLFLELFQESPETQEKRLASTIHEWMGNLEQLDDICIMGVKFR